MLDTPAIERTAGQGFELVRVPHVRELVPDGDRVEQTPPDDHDRGLESSVDPHQRARTLHRLDQHIPGVGTVLASIPLTICDFNAYGAETKGVCG